MHKSFGPQEGTRFEQALNIVPLDQVAAKETAEEQEAPLTIPSQATPPISETIAIELKHEDNQDSPAT